MADDILQLSQYSEETQQIARDLRIIDDALFRLVAEKEEVCQEILRTLLDMPELKVLRVTAQSVVQSFQREITLDALCEMADGTYCNIEMQKGKANDDISRVRFHAAAITAKYTAKGTEFGNIPEVTIVYISEYDALDNGRAVTHVTRCMESDHGYIPVNDGEDIVFANTAVDDGSVKSELLHLMLNKETFYSEKFPAISGAIGYFKGTEGGQAEVCKQVEDYAKKYADNIIKRAAEAERHLEEAQKREEEAQKHAEEAQKHAEEAQKREEEAQKREEEAQKHAEEESRRAEEAEKRAEETGDMIRTILLNSDDDEIVASLLKTTVEKVEEMREQFC